MKSKEDMPSMPPSSFHTSIDLPHLDLATRGRYRAFYLQTGNPFFIHAEQTWQVFTHRFTCVTFHKYHQMQHFYCVFQCTSGFRSSKSTHHHIQTHTANTITPWLCGIPHLLTASLKESNEGKALLRGVDGHLSLKKRKRMILEQNDQQLVRQVIRATHRPLRKADKHNMLLLSSSLHKNLIYTLHSPSARLLIFVCVCSLCRDRPVSLCNTETTLCPHYRGPILLFLCLHYFSPLFTLVLGPSHRVSILERNNAAQCPHGNEETTQTEGGSQRGLEHTE